MIASLDGRLIRRRPCRALSRLVSHTLVEGRAVLQRGRWLNPLVFGLQTVITQLPALRAVDRPIFILGAGRSGTTILGSVLAFHRDVGFLNEPKAVWHSACPDEDLIGNFGERPGRWRLTSDDASDEMRRTMSRIYGAYLVVASATRIVDKYPELIFRADFVRALFPDARFVILVRNGWDTVSSIAAWSERHGRHAHGTSIDWWGVDRRKWTSLVDEVISGDPAFDSLGVNIRQLDRTEDLAAVEWLATMREVQAVLAAHADRSMLLRFEELTDTPGDAVDGLCDACELSRDPRFRDHAQALLHPVAPRPRPLIHPALGPLFAETMGGLGYEP